MISKNIFDVLLNISCIKNLNNKDIVTDINLLKILKEIAAN